MTVYTFLIEFEDDHGWQQRVGFTLDGETGYHCRVQNAGETDRLFSLFKHHIVRSQRFSCSTRGESPAGIVSLLITQSLMNPEPQIDEWQQEDEFNSWYYEN